MGTADQNRHRLDKNLLRRTFENAAQGYDEAALLQREVGARMLERLDLISFLPNIILDIGAGTGLASSALAKRYRHAQVIAVDLAVNMLKQARQRVPVWNRWLSGIPGLPAWLESGNVRGFVCGDAEQLPFKTASVDMVFSNLTLQWCDDLDAAFREFRRVLKPGGLLMFSTFGPDTLKELRASWAQVDELNHINVFIDMHDVGDALVRAHLATPVMDVEYFTLTYADVIKLMRDLKTIGAHNITAGRNHSLTGKGRLTALTKAYERYRSDDLLPATYETVYGHAWAPDDVDTPPSQREPGVTRIPLAQLQRPAKHS